MLVYLGKLSLASNRPVLAQIYIKRALLLLAEVSNEASICVHARNRDFTH